MSASKYMSQTTFALSLLLITHATAAYETKQCGPANPDVVKRIQAYLPAQPVIVEAGAYDGEDTVELSKLLPKAQIFTFEPIPELYQKTALAIRNFANIKLYDLALSDQ